MGIFGERLKDLRLKNEMTQEELGKIVGMKKSNISKYERGDLEPGLETVKIFAEYFKVPVDYLLGRITSPSSPSLKEAPNQYITQKGDVFDIDELLANGKIRLKSGNKELTPDQRNRARMAVKIALEMMEKDGKI
jgi:transcriptional regulator with XRE-family HTH domain